MKTKKLVTTAMMLAIALMLSMIKIFELPFGGTVTPASMMPVILISYIYGVKWGISSSLIYAILQICTGMNVISAFFLPGESQMSLFKALTVCFLDYIAAYGVLGLGGIFKNKFQNRSKEILVGIIISLMLRFAIHTLSGTIFFGTWANWFFSSDSGLSQISIFKQLCESIIKNVHGTALAFLYSAFYNGFYMIPEIIITSALTPAVHKILIRLNSEHSIL